MNLSDVTLRDRIEQEVLATIIYYSSGDQHPSVMRETILTKHKLDSPDYFYSKVHQDIFRCMLKCWSEGVPPTVELLFSFSRGIIFNGENEFDIDSRSAFELHILSMVTKSVAYFALDKLIFNLKEYIIGDYWKEKANDIIYTGFESRDVLTVSDNMITEYKQLVDKFTVGLSKEANMTPKERALKEYQDVKNGVQTWIPTGIPSVDRKVKGWRRSEFSLVAARPSMGKTALMVASAKHAALRCKKAGAYFSLEVPKKQIMNHIIASETGFDYNKIKDYQLSEDDFKKVLDWYDYFENGCPLKIYDVTDCFTLDKMVTIIDETNPEYVFFDYAQLIKLQAKSSHKVREQEVAEIARTLKLISTTKNIPVIAGAQLSRNVDNTHDKRPNLSHLRESGALEQDTDNVLFPFRPAYYEEAANPTIPVPLWRKGNFDMYVAKGRDSGTYHNTFNLDFLTYKFTDGHLEAPPEPELYVGP